MAADTWVHRAARLTVRPLAATPVTPNQLTVLRLVTGLAAAWCFAFGSGAWGGSWFVLSAFLDRADGELARLTGRYSRFGHQLDLIADVLVNVLAFIGIGYGLARAGLNPDGAWLGLLAGASIALIFAVVGWLDSRGQQAVAGGGGFDPDDALFIVGPLAWLGWLDGLLLAAAIGAPLFLVCMLLLAWRSLAAGAPRES
ncbi:MAG: CDP-alcohol phosphatidyltransferase family protein [Gammaproteobacteria bacterium]|nr:MAG: CDP-alcohol phosphatidyltransferase family protein [Gammaproteobacteria bacterium]